MSDQIKMQLEKKQAVYLRAVLQNYIPVDAEDVEPEEHSNIRHELFTGLNECLSGNYDVNETIANTHTIDIEAYNKFVNNQNESSVNIEQHTYLTIVNGLCALGVKNREVGSQAKEIYSGVINRVVRLGSK